MNLTQAASVFVNGVSMPRLLVSVRNVAEAQMAIDEGVQLIDVKEPKAGSLGAASVESIRQVAAVCDRNALLSVALGELLEIPESHLPDGIFPTFVKCGLAGCCQELHWTALWEKRMEGHQQSAVAVVYADWHGAKSPSPDTIVNHAARVGCQAVLLDTFDKSKGNLLAHMTRDEIHRWMTMVQASGMKAVVAGSLTQSLIAPLLEDGVDCIALRGAACRGSRTGGLDRDKLGQLVREVASVPASGSNSLTA
ncbi:MAG: hypothetical protein CBB70_10335 [Planctomycetaceae bacterium TMED10]|nr:MAG: hypothetical protein CBB70_10335 [Planctomycetaceae bacterium TMED10]